MEEGFYIPVIYKGTTQQFEATLQQWRYGYAFHVKVEETMVIFERDEEGNYRARIPPEEKGRVPDKELLQAVGEAIEGILK